MLHLGVSGLSINAYKSAVIVSTNCLEVAFKRNLGLLRSSYWNNRFYCTFVLPLAETAKSGLCFLSLQCSIKRPAIYKVYCEKLLNFFNSYYKIFLYRTLNLSALPNIVDYNNLRNRGDVRKILLMERNGATPSIVYNKEQ